jgi:hypothetical protein
MDTDFCVTAMEGAIACFGRLEGLQRGQGSLFTSFAFTSTLKETDLDGWSWPLAARRLHRMAVAIAEMRMRLAHCLRDR